MGRPGDEVIHSSYQWVALCLLGQATFFYGPRALWLALEGGLMAHLAGKVTRHMFPSFIKQ